MAQIENTRDHYGAVAILFHWTMAVLVIGVAALGLYMTTLPDVGFNTRKVTLVLCHKELGLLALALVAARLAWRVTQILPELVAHLPDWQKVAARFVHLSFYALLVALPISGCLMSSAAGVPVSFLGVFTLPDFIHRDESLFRQLIEVHDLLGYILVLCLVVHVGAALTHHFGFKDDTLRRMLP